MPTVEPVQTQRCGICGAPVVNMQAHFEKEHKTPEGPGPVG